MFRIYDGRDCFYQWDLDRKLIVEDESITNIHFCNKTGDCSLVVEVYEEDGLRLANVPNILLQDNFRISVYAFDKNYTKHCDVFKVIKRSKPEDYVYTEEEIKVWNELENRIVALEEGNIDIDLSAYATKDEIGVKAFPIAETESMFDGMVMAFYVDIDKLENASYRLVPPPMPEGVAGYDLMFRLKCDDGTYATINGFTSTINEIIITPPYYQAITVDGKQSIVINATDKSTADKVVIEWNEAEPDYLSKIYSKEYTPTREYHPATKKYVDDAIAALKAELSK